MKEFYESQEYPHLLFYDINSSYPNATQGLMPAKQLGRSKEIGEKRVKVCDLVDYYLYNAKCEYKGNNKHYIPNLLIKSDKGDIIAVKKTEYDYHWGVELKEAIISGCEVYINEVTEYEGDTLFEEYSNYFYNLRLQHKESNPSYAEFCKLLLNNLYGKFGQGLMEHYEICNDNHDVCKIMRNTDNKITGFSELDESGKILIKYKNIEDEKKSIGSLVRFSSYIAAKARTNLAIGMRMVGYENVYYCDTDSIFTRVALPKSFIDQTKLGAWKEETKKIKYVDSDGKICEKKVLARCRYAEFLAPKVYHYEILTDVENVINNSNHCMKAKGNPQNKLNPETFKSVKKDGSIEIENDAMFIRKLDSVKIISQKRTLQPVYNKRIWTGNTSEAYDNYGDWYAAKYGMKIKSLWK